VQYIHNFTTNTLKAYLSTQPPSLSAFMISKTHIVAQKLRGRQLNAKVCGSRRAIEKDVGMGLCQYVDLCFHASFLYLVCIPFGMPSLHLFTFS